MRSGKMTASGALIKVRRESTPLPGAGPRRGQSCPMKSERMLLCSVPIRTGESPTHTNVIYITMTAPRGV